MKESQSVHSSHSAVDREAAGNLNELLLFLMGLFVLLRLSLVVVGIGLLCIVLHGVRVWACSREPVNLQRSVDIASLSVSAIGLALGFGTHLLVALSLSAIAVSILGPVVVASYNGGYRVRSLFGALGLPFGISLIAGLALRVGL